MRLLFVEINNEELFFNAFLFEKSIILVLNRLSVANAHCAVLLDGKHLCCVPITSCKACAPLS